VSAPLPIRWNWPFITLRTRCAIAKPSQTFKKRQREIKLREKAQLKRERRQQRAQERAQGIAVQPASDQHQPEGAAHEDLQD
jgi:hypothetical protein